MKIAFDLDGVVMDTYNVLVPVLKREFPSFDETKQTEYAIQLPGLSKENSSIQVRDILLNCTEHIRPLNNASLYLKQIYESLMFVPLIFITARDELLKEVTDAWVKQWVGVPSSVMYIPNSKKAKIIEQMGITHYVDDRFRNVQEICEVCDHVYLMNQLWNKGRISKHNSKRIPDLSWVLKDVRTGKFYLEYGEGY